MKNGSPPILTQASLYAALGAIRQVVWGRLFFCADAKASDSSASPGSLLESITASEFTICVADNTTYFVFTRSFQFACALLAEDWPVEVLKGTLSGILPRLGAL